MLLWGKGLKLNFATVVLFNLWCTCGVISKLLCVHAVIIFNWLKNKRGLVGPGSLTEFLAPKA